MNSIEINMSPERAVDTARYQVHVLGMRDKAPAYVLQASRPDFQQAMEEADRLRRGGRDVLVNTRDDPFVAYAKTNALRLNAIGREVWPTVGLDGFLDKGAGQHLGADFYTGISRATARPDLGDALARQVGTLAHKMELEGGPRHHETEVRQTVGSAPSTAADPAAAALTSAATTSPAPESGPAPKRAATEMAGAGQDAAPRPHLGRDGYELPEPVLKSYTVQDGKFHDRDTNTLRFQDHGKKLSTQLEDRKVIGDMLEVAAAKHWGVLELKGTDTFRQIAWLEAQTRGLQTRGYEPGERDLQQLAALRGETGGGPGERVNTIAHGGIGQRAPESRSGQAQEVEKPAPERAAGTAGQSQASKGAGGEQAQPGKPKGGPGAALTGTLVDHGAANYQHKAEEKMSYFVRLATSNGEQTLWGKGLERAMANAGGKPGDTISLARTGASAVTVDVRVRDAQGKVTGTKEIPAQRNEWHARVVTLNIERPMSLEEKTRVDAAGKILGKAVLKLPEALRAGLIEQVSRAIEKGELKIPAPRARERGVDAKVKERETPARGR